MEVCQSRIQTVINTKTLQDRRPSLDISRSSSHPRLLLKQEDRHVNGLDIVFTEGTKIRGSLSSSTMTSSMETDIDCSSSGSDDERRGHASPSSSLDSDLGSDNPDDHEQLLRRNPGAGGLFDESLLRQVNLVGAFHDHISYTKMSSELVKSMSGSMFPQTLSSPPVSSHRPTFSQNIENSIDHSCGCPSFSEEREQIQLLQDMMLTHLDMFEYQKEQLQKKDRQLLVVRQDRSNLLNRISQLEKKLTFLSKKLVAVAESKAVVSISSSPLKDGNNNHGCDQNMVFSPRKVDVETQVTPKLLPPKKKKHALEVLPVVCPTPSKKVKKFKTSLSLDASVSLSLGNKKKKNRSLSTSCVPPVTESSEDSQGADSCTSISSMKPAAPLIVAKDYLQTTEPYELVCMWDDEFDLEENNGKTIRNKVMLSDQLPSHSANCASYSMPSFPSNPSSDNIEVPSWRIMSFEPLRESIHENLEDETYNKRHVKLEIDERRRKKWDMQRLREQKNNEKLKQNSRYYSSSSFVHPDALSSSTLLASCLNNDNCKTEVDTVSFYPDPMEGELPFSFHS